MFLLAMAGVYGYHRYELYQFTRQYSAYSEAALAHETAALVPALEANPLRQDLNQALSNALADGAAEAERRAAAEEGLTLLVLAEGGLDAVGELGKEVEKALYDMEQLSGELILFSARGEMQETVARARARFEIVADIRGLSYRANHHTQEIFDRLIADQGKLTAEHVQELNHLIPQVEEQFDARSNLYADLEEAKIGVEEAFATVKDEW